MSLPSKAELETSIKGAFQLLLQKPEGLRLLDASERGYWRSFYAMLYALPFHFFVLIAAPESLQQMDEAARQAQQQAAGQGGGILSLTGHGLIYIIGWLYWPLLAFYVAQALGRAERYMVYIVAYNWARLVQLFLIAAASLLGPGILGDAGSFLVMITLFLGVFYEWSVARLALSLSGMQAAGVVLIDMIGALAVYWGAQLLQSL